MVRVKGLLTVLEIFRDCYKKFNLPTTQDDFYRLGGNFFDVLNSGLLAILAFGSIAHWDKDEPSLDVRLSKNICAILSGQKGMIDKNDKNVFLKPLGCTCAIWSRNLMISILLMFHTYHI